MLFVAGTSSGPREATTSGGFVVIVVNVVIAADVADDDVVVVVALLIAETGILADLTADDGNLDRVGVETGDIRVLKGGPFKIVRLPTKLVADPPPRFGRRRFELGVPASD